MAKFRDHLLQAISRGSRGFSGLGRRSGSIGRSRSIEASPKPKPLHLEMEVIAIGVGLRFVELEEGKQVSASTIVKLIITLPTCTQSTGHVDGTRRIIGLGGCLCLQEKDALRVNTPNKEAAPRTPRDVNRSVRMLAAYMDLGACYKIAGDRQRASAELRGLHVETLVDVGTDKVRRRCLGNVC